jgi:hypothetical protein
VRQFKQMFRALSSALIAIGFLSACGGSHAGGSALPALPGTHLHGSAVTGTAGTTVVAINAGGSVTGTFAADTDFAAAGTWTYKSSAVVDTSAVTSPAPQAAYADEREGSTISYTIPGLTAGAAYSVRLSFTELWWSAAGQRTFNVSINNTKVLSNFDVFAAAGARNKAVAQSFAATASSTGTIVVVLNAVTDYAALNAIEIISGGSTPTPAPTPVPTPTAAPAAIVALNSGGLATGGFSADGDVAAGGTWTYKTSAAVDTSGVTNAPQAVYADEREGSTISYTIPGLSAGTPYTVRLSFAELWWTAAGQRVFNVAINNTRVLTNFDVIAAAGTRFKAVTQSFTATANGAGAIVIVFTAVTDNAAVNAIEIAAAGGVPTPAPTPPLTGFNDYTTFGYDNQRDVFNPNSTSITPASLSNLHLAWQATLGGGDYNTQSQPMLATQIPGHQGVIYVGGGSGNVYGYDALSGASLWTQHTGQETYTCENGYVAYFGVGGTAAYDPASRSLYVVGNTNSAVNAPAVNSLYHLDGASGAVLGSVNFAPAVAGWPSLDFSHTSVTLGSNGLAYVGTSATCDISSWRGRIAAVSVPSMTLANTFYPDWNPATQPWGGGGVWGWGGVSLDFSGNVLTGIGNTDDGSTNHGAIVAPFRAAPAEYSGLGDAFVKVSADLTTLVDSSHPIATSSYSGDSVDLDINGTPAVFRPPGTGCSPLAALQAKSGSLYVYDTTQIGRGPLAQYQLAPSTYSDGFLGGPAFSSASRLLYAAVPSSSGSLDDRNQSRLREPVRGLAQRVRPRFISQRNTALGPGRERRRRRVRGHALCSGRQRQLHGQRHAVGGAPDAGRAAQTRDLLRSDGSRRRRAVGARRLDGDGAQRRQAAHLHQRSAARAADHRRELDLRLG